MSDWKKRAAERRDARHGGPIRISSTRSKKDRRRWCRGKEGVEHETKAVKYDAVKGTTTFPSGRTWTRPDWWLLICTRCGKELDRYWPTSLYKAERPDWVPKGG